MNNLIEIQRNLCLLNVTRCDVFRIFELSTIDNNAFTNCCSDSSIIDSEQENDMEIEASNFDLSGIESRQTYSPDRIFDSLKKMNYVVYC